MDSSKCYMYRRCARTSCRVTFLQHQLQDLSERERRAQNYNRKLLQEFQRAQNTLSELVACTEAMNTIRMEYDRFLEENYPNWQQKLKDKRLSEKRKMIEHLKACMPKMTENTQSIDRALINGDKERREKEKREKSEDVSASSQIHAHRKWGHKKKVNSNDTKPVNIINCYGHSSESSDLSCNAVKSLLTEVQLKKTKRRKIKQTRSVRNDAVSQESVSTSDSRDHKKHKTIQQNSNWRNAAYRTSNVVDSPKQLVKENKEDSKLIEGANVSCKGEKGALQKLSESEIIIRKKQVNVKVNRYLTEYENKRARLCEVQDTKGCIKEYRRLRSSDEEQVQEEEALSSNTSVKESVLEEEVSVRETDEKEKEGGGRGVGEQKEEDGEKEVKNKEASVRRRREDYIESVQEENYSDGLASGSDRNIEDSLRDLYKDKTEDDLTEKEANIGDDYDDDDSAEDDDNDGDDSEDDDDNDGDDSEDDDDDDDNNDDDDDDNDDDDDDVIVEKASPWSCHPADTKHQNDDDDDDVIVEKATPLACHPKDTTFDDVIVEKANSLACEPEHSKYQDDDDDDDIEGILAPQNNPLQHQ